MKRWGLDPAVDSTEAPPASAILVKILFASCLAFLFASVIAACSQDWRLAKMLLACVAMHAVPYGLLRRGYVNASSSILVFALVGSLTAFATLGQGIRDVAIVAFPVIYCFTIMTLNRTIFRLCVGATLVAVGWLSAGELNGWFTPRPFDAPSWLDLILTAVILLVAAFAVDLLATNVQAHLERARREVTRRERLEAALRESDERFTLSMEATNDGLWDWNIKTDEGYFSPSYYHMLGYEVGAFPMDGKAWSDLIHPADRERAVHANRECIEGRSELFTVEYRMKAGNGDWRWILARGKCVARDEHGRARRLVGTHVDITERKEAEAEQGRLEATYRQLQKSESLSRMAGAVAHHFNNQLQVVLGSLELAQSDLPREVRGIEDLNNAMEAARRAVEVSSLMLTYLGHVRGRRGPLDLSDACREPLPVLQAAMPKNVVFDIDLPSPGPVVAADASQLQQAMTNLITNAWEAAGKAPCVVHLSVSTALLADVARLHRFPVDWQPKAHAYACLAVADTGGGIAAADIETLFDPFFSSKFTGRGMGLAVVLGMVRAHEGVITVASELGRGSVFCVYLPLADSTVIDERMAEQQGLVNL